MRFWENNKRSIAKSLSYRLIIVIVNSLAVYFLTGNIVASLGMAVTTSILGTLIYYLHERVWNTIHWGKHR